ncbi:MAG: transporter [Halomonas sp.]|jgi:Na+/H+ antiporter NhaD/arsenite permease-like protein|uniref:Transporter n=1 Tax=Billgrantia tianxiuensis TaxID=2497861 RepID=A0A6I6SWM9_9GAMM|nr:MULTISPECIES: SLC13 family permease [Halomonas]MCE8035252.1 transporter [Halomonas sp. MCCC 1A11057]MDX5435361.1 transporter [Halomonas sp.]QHC51933.1 transporter [Halomonas tianxiuensis]
MLRALRRRLRQDLLLMVLLAALPLLLVALPEQAGSLHHLVHWDTLAALSALMVLSRALEESGALSRVGRRLVSRTGSERSLALVLVLLSAALSAVVTNDVALFIVVPLTLGLRLVATLPIARLVVFEALAVNAGSAISPIGNPQNLFLWQQAEVGFLAFSVAMAPLSLGLLVLLLAAIPLAFPAHAIELSPSGSPPPLKSRLAGLSLALYVPLLLLIDAGLALPSAVGIVALYLLFQPRVVRYVDWLLLLVFVLMFMVLGLAVKLGPIAQIVEHLATWPGGMLTAGAVLSQGISNVPAAILLDGFTDDWRTLAWGVSVGGFGLAIGSMANVIALRLAREKGLWREFHRWSLPMLLLGWLMGLLLLSI